MKHIIISILFLLNVIAVFSQTNSLFTVAEKTEFKSTSTHEDVMIFIEGLKKISNKIKVETIATTFEGREIPLLIIADPIPKSANEFKKDKRVVVYIQANIHAGEVEGKEATLMFARDLLLNPDKKIFDNVILLICPIFNADGNDRISKENRTNQNGPENGVGIRSNAMFLDLNRDAIKLESEEVSGLLQNVINKYDPSVMMDCHTTNGSFHKEPVTFTWMMNPNGDRTLINYMRDKMMPEMTSILTNKYKTLNCFYGEFVNRESIDSGWISYASEPRYLTNYIGVRNRLSILNENYVYADFKTRVYGCYNLIKSLVDYSSENSSEIKKLIYDSDFKMNNRQTEIADSDSFAIKYQVYPTPNKITIQAFEADTIPGAKGYFRYKQSNRQRTVTVPYLADYFATKSIKMPYAYLITIPDPKVLENLKKHGIQIEYLIEAEKLETEHFIIEDLHSEQRLNQGHYTNIVKGKTITETLDFKKGTIMIKTAQPLGNLAAYLLEPESDDGYLVWNFFDKYLVPQWSSNYYPYPVYRIMKKF